MSGILPQRRSNPTCRTRLSCSTSRIPLTRWLPTEAHSCCGVDYPLICLGEQDVACWFHIHPWDHLPGSLMVTECGGVVRVADGADYTARHTEQRGVIIAASDERSWQIAAQALEEN
ncbi:MAG: hypothetical protein DI580_13680 [Cutibacterium acnes]|nr:MAG: hypothetical protein DI580_13680 [Cutibacterium acnes]